MIIKKDKLLAVKTGFLKMIVGVLKLVIHNTFEIGVYIYIYIYIYLFIYLFNRTTFQVFVTYLTGALYVHSL